MYSEKEDTASSSHTSLLVDEDQIGSSPSVDEFDRYGRWLSSIPRDDILALRGTQEYREFLQAFQQLGDAHRRVISMNRETVLPMDMSRHDTDTSTGISKNNQTSQHHIGNPTDFIVIFLQYITADDVVLRIFEFLECQSLIRMAFTCTRFRDLAYQSAYQRTYTVAQSRQLGSSMQLLRAQEQINGVDIGIHDSFVQVPMLLLNRRILVSNAGDSEVNGVYFCTATNGNGFVFTKPRTPLQRVQSTESPNNSITIPPDDSMEVPRDDIAPQHINNNNDNAAHERRRREDGFIPDNIEMINPHPIGAVLDEDRLEREKVLPGQLLRCVIAKRFSNERIVWSLSKEIQLTEPRNGRQIGDVSHVGLYWARLMGHGDASPDACLYPSQTSILQSRGGAWRGINTTVSAPAPNVELLP